MAFVSDLERDFYKLAGLCRLGHAYLFFGKSEREQRQLAHNIARHLEHGIAGKSEEFLDSMTLDARKQSGIAATRDGISFLSLMPVRSARRTLVIFAAERFTVEAQQAFLKIVEEPPRHALILCCVSDYELIIRPLASRFQKIYVSGDARPVQTERGTASMQAFIAARTLRERVELLQGIVADDGGTLEEFLTSIVSFLWRNPQKNWRIVRELLHRWAFMRRLNTNQRLQLEAALVSIDANM